MNEPLNRLTTSLSTMIRLGRARRPGRAAAVMPAEPLVLYEFESCPMCRRVREALTDLGLPTIVRPCPRDGTRYRPDAEARTGKSQFPFLMDPNTGAELLESTDIVAYLYATYGARPVPWWLRDPTFALTATLASLTRMGAGFRARPSAPVGELVLVGNEGDPRARLVRERLSELEVSYLRLPGPFELRNLSSGSVARDVRTAARMLSPASTVAGLAA